MQTNIHIKEQILTGTPESHKEEKRGNLRLKERRQKVTEQKDMLLRSYAREAQTPFEDKE